MEPQFKPGRWYFITHTRDGDGFTTFYAAESKPDKRRKEDA